MASKQVVTEMDAAQQSGPIAMKEPGSPAWCWQLIAALQTQWRSLNFDYELYKRTWEEAESYEVWNKVPYDNPYGSKEQMLEALKVGDVPAAKARVAERAMAAAPLADHGTNQHSGGHAVRHVLPGSNRADYLIARIARDHPSIWERMKQGEFASVAAAAREAGINVPRKTKTLALGNNMNRLAERLSKHYTQEQFAELSLRMLQLRRQARRG